MFFVQIKLKKSLFSIVILVLSICFIPHLTIFAADPSNYGFFRVDKSNVKDYPLLTWVYFRDNNGQIWYGSANHLFDFLKADNEDEINTALNIRWGDVSSGADVYDSLSLMGEILIHNKGAASMITNSAYNILELSSTEAHIVTSFYEPLKPICVLLICMYSLMAFVKLVENENTKFRPILKLIFTILVITWLCSHLDQICYLFYSIYNTFLGWMEQQLPYTKVHGASVYSYDELVQMAMAVDGTSFIDSYARVLTELAYIIFGEIILTITLTTTLFLFYSIHLTMAMRCLFLPIVMPSIIDGGKRSKGMNFLKNTLGAALEGGSYILILQAGVSYSSALNTLQNSALSYLFVPFGLLAGLTAARLVTKEITQAISIEFLLIFIGMVIFFCHIPVF